MEMFIASGSNPVQILVDQQLLSGYSASSMLPMPQAIAQTSVPVHQPVCQVPQMQVNQRATIPPVQQISHKQYQIGTYGQPQVTSSTDLVRNNPQMRQQMMNNQMNYRARGPAPNQQQQGQEFQPPAYSNINQPMPLRQNKNISTATFKSPSGPSPSKQSSSDMVQFEDSTVAPDNIKIKLRKTLNLGWLRESYNSAEGCCDKFRAELIKLKYMKMNNCKNNKEKIAKIQKLIHSYREELKACVDKLSHNYSKHMEQLQKEATSEIENDENSVIEISDDDDVVIIEDSIKKD